MPVALHLDVPPNLALQGFLLCIKMGGWEFCWLLRAGLEGTMVDSVSSSLRSEIMSRVRHKDTRPEMIVRRMLHKAGYRFRLHGMTLPGKPDLVFTARRKVIFIHGCFWHLHDCGHVRIPKSRIDFWTRKLNANRQRDQKNLIELRLLGWEVLTVWECQLGDIGLLKRMQRFLGSKQSLDPFSRQRGKLGFTKPGDENEEIPLKNRDK